MIYASVANCISLHEVNAAVLAIDAGLMSKCRQRFADKLRALQMKSTLQLTNIHTCIQCMYVVVMTSRSMRLRRHTNCGGKVKDMPASAVYNRSE